MTRSKSIFLAATLFGAVSALSLSASPTLAQGTSGTMAAPAQPPMQHKTMHHSSHHQGGHGSQQTMAAQQALNAQGATLKVDGISGPQTRAAIKSFQAAHGLKATGHLDAATSKALKGG